MSRDFFPEASLAPATATWSIADTGPAGETLSIDAVWDGPRNARRVLLVVAGTHGIEGVAGRIILERRFGHASRAALPPDTAILFIPCLNPHGAAWSRTETSAGIDLNRNFIEAGEDRPQNIGYAAVHGGLIDPDPIMSGKVINDFKLMVGFDAFVTAAHEGQYSHPDGLTYGGNTLCHEARIFLEVLELFIGDARRVAVIDVHTGIGDRGASLLISPTIAAAREAFGAKAIPPGHPQVGYAPSGTLISGVVRYLSDRELLATVLEFGTEPPEVVSRALIDSHRLRVLGPSAVENAAGVAAAMRAAFAPDDQDWREAVAERGCEVIDQALVWLSRPL